MRAIWFMMLLVAATTGEAQAAEIEQFFMPGELISGHQELETECTNCHIRLRDTTQEKLCLDCHDHKTVAEDIQKKQGFHGKDEKARTLECKACHSEHKGRDAQIVWLDKDKFDHRFTDYELSGQHQLTECASCHLEDKKYREAKHGCFDCHSEDDAHEGKLGEKCDSCHNPSGWGRSEFDHDNTEFKLRLSHQQVNCNACHIGDKYKDTPKQCVNCHEIRDVHARRFGIKCQTCHQEDAWDKSIFDHDEDTDYPLEASHRKAGCNDCHSEKYRVSERKNEIRNCYSCHRSDDAHDGLNGDECQNCHVVRGWPYAEFDHGANTDFALNGAHENLACEACHALGADSKEIDTDCYSCHKQDDAHESEQGTECNQCHREVAWLQDVRFDHDLTEFPLIGQHAAAGCESCHATSVFNDTGSKCNDCHGSEDVHEQALGEKCELCHNPNDWLIWSFDHEQTDFKLRQVHAETHCHSCHYKPLEEIDRSSWRCADCHRRDDIHDGDFGNNCGRCHNQQSFDELDIQSLKHLNSKPTAGAPE